MRQKRADRWVVLCSVSLALALGCAGGAGDDTGGEKSAAAAAGKEPVSTTEAADNAPPRVDLVGAWLLEDLGGRGVMDMVRTTIEFDAEGKVVGSGGCNRFTGGYTFEDGRLEIGPLAGTKMMCPEAVMAQEELRELMTRS